MAGAAGHATAVGLVAGEGREVHAEGQLQILKRTSGENETDCTALLESNLGMNLLTYLLRRSSARPGGPWPSSFSETTFDSAFEFLLKSQNSALTVL